MYVHNSKMLSVFIIVNLIFLAPHCSVKAFHIDKKPLIYINLFDEVLTDNASTKVLPSTSSPEHHISTNDVKKKLNLTEELFKLNDMNNTSASAPYDSLLEFDMPSKADITENFVNGSDSDSSTLGNSDLFEPDFLEPELTRMFFLRAMASLMEHIMVALFSDTTAKLTEAPGFDYELTSPRNLSKRELPIEENVEQKTNSSIVATTGSLSINHSSPIESSADILELLKTTGKSTQNKSEQSSHILDSEHVSLHYGSHRTSDNRAHAGKRENSARLTGGLKNDLETEFHPEAGILNQPKQNIHKHLPLRTASVDEDYMKMFPLSDESSELNDDLRNKKDTHSYEGVVHFVEDQDNQAGKEEDSTAKSAFVVTVILIGTTALVLMLLGALALAAGYFFRKNQASENQNTTDVNTSTA